MLIPTIFLNFINIRHKIPQDDFSVLSHVIVYKSNYNYDNNNYEYYLQNGNRIFASYFACFAVYHEVILLAAEFEGRLPQRKNHVFVCRINIINAHALNLRVACHMASHNVVGNQGFQKTVYLLLSYSPCVFEACGVFLCYEA